MRPSQNSPQKTNKLLSTPKFKARQGREQTRASKLRKLINQFRQHSASREKQYHSIKIASFEQISSLYSSTFYLCEQSARNKRQRKLKQIMRKCEQVIKMQDNAVIEKDVYEFVNERLGSKAASKEVELLIQRHKF